jgi:hypothetical protein
MLSVSISLWLVTASMAPEKGQKGQAEEAPAAKDMVRGRQLFLLLLDLPGQRRDGAPRDSQNAVLSVNSTPVLTLSLAFSLDLPAVPYPDGIPNRQLTQAARTAEANAMGRPWFFCPLFPLPGAVRCFQ